MADMTSIVVFSLDSLSNLTDASKSVLILERLIRFFSTLRFHRLDRKDAVLHTRAKSRSSSSTLKFIFKISDSEAYGMNFFIPLIKVAPDPWLLLQRNMAWDKLSFVGFSP